MNDMVRSDLGHDILLELGVPIPVCNIDPLVSPWQPGSDICTLPSSSHGWEDPCRNSPTTLPDVEIKADLNTLEMVKDSSKSTVPRC